MESSQEEALTLGRRCSPSPPPPPPPPSAQHADQLQKDEEESPIVAASSLPDDHAPQELEEEEEGEEEEAAIQSVEGPAIVTDDLRDKIVRQVEYYFSDENLPTDKFMSKHVTKDKQGFVPIVVIASFRRMKRLVRDLSLIEAALKTSSQLVVSKDGRKVRRLHPLPVIETKDSKLCTVIVENLPDDYSTENLQKIFANMGKILNITIHDPRATEESKATGKEKTFSNKLHALIEYETTEAAANAVATLNDQKNWRSGMRVEILPKWMSKYGLIGRRRKETFSEKSSDNRPSEIASDGLRLTFDEHHADESKNEDEEHFAGGKGRYRNRYKNRARGQQNASGQGHGQLPSGSSNGVNKPPPGPRMPDGTRGFTMGRGKPPICEPNQVGV